MQEVRTKDGSVTYYNHEVGEHYHSISGAKEEAIEKHGKPAIEFVRAHGLTRVDVLDFCYGLGYNSYYFINELRKIDKDVTVEIIGVDIDREIVEKGKYLLPLRSDERTKISIHVGDAISYLHNNNKSFDVCFFDPFSPKKQPEMWSEEVFKWLFKAMKKPAIVTTYSCAKSIRDNMKKAGFIIKDGPVVGRRAPATIALK